MTRHILRTGKQTRPKTAVKGKRYRCAKCHRRSPKRVMAPAPWYCPKCSPPDAPPVSSAAYGRERHKRPAC
jgi:hypothetical protein